MDEEDEERTMHTKPVPGRRTTVTRSRMLQAAGEAIKAWNAYGAKGVSGALPVHAAMRELGRAVDLEEHPVITRARWPAARLDELADLLMNVYQNAVRYGIHGTDALVLSESANALRAAAETARQGDGVKDALEALMRPVIERIVTEAIEARSPDRPE